jgi:hypothetical protein
MLESTTAPPSAKLYAYVTVFFLLNWVISHPSQLWPPEDVDPGKLGFPMMLFALGLAPLMLNSVFVYESPLWHSCKQTEYRLYFSFAKNLQCEHISRVLSCAE